jgi:hypothetical protein
MPYAIVRAATSLQIVQPDGTLTTLTLPSGVTLDSSRPARFAILGRHILMVNSPSINLHIDTSDFTVRPMSLKPPVESPVLSAGTGGTGLTGNYRGGVSFAIKNPDDGTILNESPMSPISIVQALSNESLRWSGIPISEQAAVNTRRLYRTAAGGSVLFHEADIDDNTTTSIETQLADAGLSLLPEDQELGTPPGTIPGTFLKIIVSWGGRLWAVSDWLGRRDTVLYTEDGQFYAWGNEFPIAPVGFDNVGVTGFVPRRDELIILKQAHIAKIKGDSDANFEVIDMAVGPGCVAPDSVVVVRDVGYFLGKDGVYSVGPQGVQLISRDKVHPWFTTDTVFNRSEFPNAKGGYNPITDTYDLHLAAANQTTLNRWVSYDIRRGEWLGPHLTGKFTPSHRALLYDSNSLERPTIAGADGHLYEMNQSGASDGGDTAIAIDWLTKYFSAGAPDIYHHWGDGALLLKKQNAGSLTLTPAVGDIGVAPATARTVAMSRYRVRVGRFGDGNLLQIRFQHSTDAEDVELYGLEIPYFEIGRR